jgi:hypothetical protein
MTAVVVVPPICSNVLNVETAHEARWAGHTVVASVCWVIGTQLTVLQPLAAVVTTIDVLAGNDRCTPSRLRLSPPVVSYV